ncbi:MAG TPA: hypothetical protein PKW35_11495, partial [Nannocystaceae bacterium]|nr:hypothetical protein [Nannocystaceae bacterium]
PPTDDPEVLENREQLLRGLVKVFPRLRDEMIAEARKDGLDEGEMRWSRPRRGGRRGWERAGSRRGVGGRTAGVSPIWAIVGGRAPTR